MALRERRVHGKKTPIPVRLLKDGEFLRKVRILLDGCSVDPEKVLYAQEAALKIVGPVKKGRKGSIVGVEVIPADCCGKYFGKGAIAESRIIKKDYAPKGGFAQVVPPDIAIRSGRYALPSKEHTFEAGCSEPELA